MKPAVTHMGYLFQSGALHTEHSVIELCSPCSPALESIAFYFMILSDLGVGFVGSSCGSFGWPLAAARAPFVVEFCDAGTRSHPHALVLALFALALASCRNVCEACC